MGKLAILGPQGTHSEAAAVYLNGLLDNAYELVPFGEIYDALVAVEDGRAEAAFVPVENSLEGAVNITLDALATGDCFKVVRELIWPVRNELMAKCRFEDIKKIYSHPQPISQCRRFLRRYFPDTEIIKVASTARAAQLVAEEAPTDGAAICTRRAGELNGLSAVVGGIQDNMENCTRFFEVKRRTAENILPVDKTLVICNIDGAKSGSLLLVLEEFASRGVNLTRIESRPARTRLGEYVFFFDLEANTTQEAREEAIAAVKKRSIWLKDLGSFPVIKVKERI